MEEENHDSEKEFPGLYASETSYRSDSDYNENSHEKGGKKELLRSKKKEKGKDKGYAALDPESSGDEMDYLDMKNPLKSKRPKSFKFLQKKDKEEKEDKKEEKKKKEKDEKDDKKREKKKKEEQKLKEKEEKKKIKKDKKKKGSIERFPEEDLAVFGMPLSIAVEKCPSHDGIRLPIIVRECIDLVEEKGLHSEGIYRLGGMKSKVQSLRRAYNAGEVVQLDDQQPHVVASLLKQYLRELPETILTVDMMPHFEDVSLIPNPRERAEALRQLIDRLPTTNRLLLQYVLKHMGHIIELEKDTKMSYHNVCVVLSPTMQISHRVLNVMFHSHQYLFGNIEIKKYIPPISSYSGMKRSIDDLKTLADIEGEIQKQESLLATLHSAIAAGRISQKKEEQLWEAQRNVTHLKRKLKSVQRRELGEFHKSHLDSCLDKELSSEDSQKDVVIFPQKISNGKGKCTSGSTEGEDMENDKNVSAEVKSSSETDTAGTPTFKTASNEPSSRKSSEGGAEGDSDRSQASSLPTLSGASSVATKKEDSSKVEHQKEPIIPMLPKPLSARAERNKLAQGREKSSSIDAAFSHRKREDLPPHYLAEKVPANVIHQDATWKPTQRGIQHSVDIPNKAITTDAKRMPFEKDSIQRISTMSEIVENEVSVCSPRYLPLINKEKRVAKTFGTSANKQKETRNVQPSQVFNEDTEYSVLAKEESRLHMEHEELLTMNQELTRKLQSEKSDISRLRDEIQEMQTLYGYRTHSYDSSESEGSESEGESDTEDEILKQIVVMDKANKQAKFENVTLTKRIQDEREMIIRLKVALRQAQLTTKMPLEIVSTC